MRRNHAFGFLLVGASCLVLAHSTLAATVERRLATPDFADDFYDVQVSSTTAEEDDLTVTRKGSHVVVRQRSFAGLRAGDGCSQHGWGEVRCSRARLECVCISLGGGDDVLHVEWPLSDSAVDIQVFAGRGRDRVIAHMPNGFVVGQGDADVIEGGAGDDDLSGGPGRDRLYGGRGADVLDGDAIPYDRPEPVTDDLLDGGPGRDTASWQLRTTRVVADIARGYGGGAGEHDTLRSIENLTGGVGADVLRGDGGPNLLSGGPGTDLLIGRAGNDTMDAFDGIAQESDRVRCGPGIDRVRFASEDDQVAADCESRSVTKAVSRPAAASATSGSASRSANRPKYTPPS